MTENGHTSIWTNALRGLVVAGVIAVGTLTDATTGKTITFDQNEAGLLHGSGCSCDGHNCCAMGMNTAGGHYTVKMEWSSVTPKVTKGVAEYQFENGDLLYARVTVTPRDSSGFRTLTIEFSGGTGNFAYTYGRATGRLTCNAASCGCESYTGKISGVVGWYNTRILE